MLLKSELDKEVVKNREINENLKGRDEQLHESRCRQLNNKVRFFDFALLVDRLTLTWLFLGCKPFGGN